jgi:hypothetical protein
MSSNSKTTVDAMKESDVYGYSFAIDSTEQKDCDEETHGIENALDYDEKVLLVATLDHIMERISSCICSCSYVHSHAADQKRVEHRM